MSLDAGRPGLPAGGHQVGDLAEQGDADGRVVLPGTLLAR
ncbi:hypothetical protein FsymDg_1540 [Candidatus Protofrankia datiscae]|uniref:Uncharacterized protein n=1 Tax=Candidatus Protofrankia datiscae TaxID=2716812 RepID=F8B3Q5_9ACTN|nr:hypothetical protein FsymDg_1540 [Candidatus Protofrankia datiscae]